MVRKMNKQEMEGDTILIFKPRTNKGLKCHNVYEIGRREVILRLLKKVEENNPASDRIKRQVGRSQGLE